MNSKTSYWLERAAQCRAGAALAPAPVAARLRAIAESYDALTQPAPVKCVVMEDCESARARAAFGITPKAQAIATPQKDGGNAGRVYTAPTRLAESLPHS